MPPLNSVTEAPIQFVKRARWTRKLLRARGSAKADIVIVDVEQFGEVAAAIRLYLRLPEGLRVVAPSAVSLKAAHFGVSKRLKGSFCVMRSQMLQVASFKA